MPTFKEQLVESEDPTSLFLDTDIEEIKPEVQNLNNITRLTDLILKMVSDADISSLENLSAKSLLIQKECRAEDMTFQRHLDSAIKVRHLALSINGMETPAWAFKELSLDIYLPYAGLFKSYIDSLTEDDVTTLQKAIFETSSIAQSEGIKTFIHQASPDSTLDKALVEDKISYYKRYATQTFFNAKASLLNEVDSLKSYLPNNPLRHKAKERNSQGEDTPSSPSHS